MSNATWMYHQSGAIPFRYRSGSWEVMLITSRTKRRWAIPKGFIEPGLSALVSAAKEAWEEAGVHGQLSAQPIGSYRFAKWEGVCCVKVFLLEVRDISRIWPEMSFRKRLWVSIDEAPRQVKPGPLREILLRVRERLVKWPRRVFISPETELQGKKLVLLRHAKSSWKEPGLDDFERPLNARGVRDAPRLGQWLSKSDLLIDAIVCSPAERAAHTARLVADEIGFSRDAIRWEPTLYEAPLNRLMHLVGAFDDRWCQVLLIGHNPGLHELLTHLSEIHLHKLPTCGVATLTLPIHHWQGITSGSANDCQLITPRGLAD